MSTPKQKPTSGGNHLAGSKSQNTAPSLPSLKEMKRIAAALEKRCELAAEQNHLLHLISVSLDLIAER